MAAKLHRCARLVEEEKYLSTHTLTFHGKKISFVSVCLAAWLRQQIRFNGPHALVT